MIEKNLDCVIFEIFQQITQQLIQRHVQQQHPLPTQRMSPLQFLRPNPQVRHTLNKNDQK